MKARLNIFLQITLIHVNIVFGAWNYTAILVKENADLNNPNVKNMINGEDFVELIQTSELWMDKSLLIKAIWDESWKLFLNICPRRWGKTINLEMIKFYHQVPINEDGSLAHRENSMNFLYFVHGKIWNGETWRKTKAPPLISKYPNHLKHLGKYPVIHLHGGGLRADPEQRARIEFAKMIYKTYNEHVYLKKFLKKKSETDIEALDDLDSFVKFYNGSKSDSLELWDYSDSILTLSEILNKTYNEKVIILFDEYDVFVGKTFFKAATLPNDDQWTSFIDFFQDFMGRSFKQSSIYMAKGIITGILPIREITGLTGTNNAEVKSVFGLEDFYPFYGVFEDEFNIMANLRKIPKKKISEATQMYDGYRTLSQPESPMYATLSATKFITTLTLRDYWAESAVTQIVAELYNHTDFMRDVGLLMNTWEHNEKSAITIPYSKMFSLVDEDFKEIFKLRHKITNYISMVHRPIVFSLLLSMGYVSINPNQMQNPLTLRDRKIGIKIPNREIFGQYKKQYISFLGLEAHDNQTDTLENFLRANDRSTLFPLVKAMSDYFRQKTFNCDLGKVNASMQVFSERFDRPFPHGTEALAEFFILGFFYQEMSYQVPSSENIPHFRYSAMEQFIHKGFYNSEVRIDIFLTDKKHSALVLEIKYQDTEVFNVKKTDLRNAFIQCLMYVQFFRDILSIDVKWVKLMALVVYKNGNMESMALCLTSDEVQDIIAEEERYFAEHNSSDPRTNRENWSREKYQQIYEEASVRIWFSQYDRSKSDDPMQYASQNERTDIPPPHTKKVTTSTTKSTNAIRR